MSPRFLKNKPTGALIPRRRTGHSSAEFAASLIVFFFLMFFPLLNLVGVALSAGMLCMLTHQIATRASQQLTYADALSTMRSECSRLMSTGWANFLRLQPKAGYQKCGSDLYIESTQVAGSNIRLYGPNQPLPNAPNPNYVYEYLASTSFQVKPFIPMSGVPFVAQVPALGQPVEIRWNAARAVEHVAGLSSANFGTQNQNLIFPNLTQLAGQDPVPTFLGNGSGAPVGWRNPGVYPAIPPNLTIVGLNVFIVPATSMTWVSSQLSVQPGQSVWVDTHADGLWSFCPGGRIVDANGGPPTTNFRAFGTNPSEIQPEFVCLVGCVSDSPPNVKSQLNTLIPTPQIAVPFPGYILLGDNSLTLNPGTGQFSAVCNDRMRQDNRGEQVVRVLILE